MLFPTLEGSVNAHNIGGKNRRDFAWPVGNFELQALRFAVGGVLPNAEGEEAAVMLAKLVLPFILCTGIFPLICRLYDLRLGKMLSLQVPLVTHGWKEIGILFVGSSDRSGAGPFFEPSCGSPSWRVDH